MFPGQRRRGSGEPRPSSWGLPKFKMVGGSEGALKADLGFEQGDTGRNSLPRAASLNRRIAPRLSLPQVPLRREKSNSNWPSSAGGPWSLEGRLEGVREGGRFHGDETESTPHTPAAPPALDQTSAAARNTHQSREMWTPDEAGGAGADQAEEGQGGEGHREEDTFGGGMRAANSEGGVDASDRDVSRNADGSEPSEMKASAAREGPTSEPKAIVTSAHAPIMATPDVSSIRGRGRGMDVSSICLQAGGMQVDAVRGGGLSEPRQETDAERLGRDASSPTAVMTPQQFISALPQNSCGSAEPSGANVHGDAENAEAGLETGKDAGRGIEGGEGRGEARGGAAREAGRESVDGAGRKHQVGEEDVGAGLGSAPDKHESNGNGGSDSSLEVFLREIQIDSEAADESERLDEGPVATIGDMCRKIGGGVDRAESLPQSASSCDASSSRRRTAADQDRRSQANDDAAAGAPVDLEKGFTMVSGRFTLGAAPRSDGAIVAAPSPAFSPRASWSVTASRSHSTSDQHSRTESETGSLRVPTSPRPPSASPGLSQAFRRPPSSRRRPTQFARKDEHLFEFLRKFYLIRTSEPATPLDDRLKGNKTSAYANAGDFSVLRTPYPVASALCKQWFTTAVALLGVIYAVVFVLSLTGNLRRGSVQTDCIKLVIHELAGSEIPPEPQPPILHSFGVLEHDSCRRRIGDYQPVPGTEYIFRSDLPFDIHGFYLQNGNVSMKRYPSVFSLHAGEACTEERDVEWRLVGSSRRYFHANGRVQWFLEPFPFARDQEYDVLQVDFRPPWFFWLGPFVCRPCLVLLSGGLSVIGNIQRPHLGSQCILIALCALLVGWSIFAVGSISNHHYRSEQFPIQWLHPLQALIMLVGFRCGEKYMPEIAVFGGAWSIGYAFLERYFVSDQSTQLRESDTYLYGGHFLESTAWVVLGLVLMVLRRRAQSTSWKLIQADAKNYRDAWERLARVQENKDAMPRLQEFCKRCPPPAKLLQLRLDQDASADEGIPMLASFISRRRIKRDISQFLPSEGHNRTRLDTVSSRGSMTPVSAPNEAMNASVNGETASMSARGSTASEVRGATQMSYRPVTSLDQLYVQAAGVHALLVQKVRAWGIDAGGRCRVEGCSDFVKWEEVQGNRLMENRVKYAVLKRHERAIEKIIRAYNGKVARLCDVCRESLYFDDLSQILNCLHAIRADTDVKLLSVKNRYAPDYEDAKTAGYRDLNVNLQIVTDESKAMGVHLHICEIQLILTQFAYLKTDSGHKRYVAYRNALGE